MSTLVILVVFAWIIFVVFALAKYSKNSQPRYIKKNLMTGNEIEFFHRLSRAIPEYHVFPQLAMSAVIKPVQSYQKNQIAYFNINKKIIDYGIYSSKMELICLVELDDRTHDASKDAQRDKYTKSAGIKTLRWQSKSKPDIQTIASAIREVAGMKIKNNL